MEFSLTEGLAVAPLEVKKSEVLTEDFLDLLGGNSYDYEETGDTHIFQLWNVDERDFERNREFCDQLVELGYTEIEPKGE